MKVSFLMFILVLASCERTQQRSPEPSTAQKDQTTKSRFYGQGRVVKIDTARQVILIQHQEIPNFMSAMTMSFFLEKTELVQGVQVGDSIHFTLTKGDRRLFVSEINVIK